jgi:hypothetical protein
MRLKSALRPEHVETSADRLESPAAVAENLNPRIGSVSRDLGYCHLEVQTLRSAYVPPRPRGLARNSSSRSTIAPGRRSLLRADLPLASSEASGHVFHRIPMISALRSALKKLRGFLE